MAAFQSVAVVQSDSRRAAIVDVDLRNPRPQPQFASQGFEPPYERLENQPHAGIGAGQAFAIDAAKHDRKLREVHVVLSRAAVIHQRAEQHLDQQRVAQVLFEQRPGRAIGLFKVEVVVIGNLGD